MHSQLTRPLLAVAIVAALSSAPFHAAHADAAPDAPADASPNPAAASDAFATDDAGGRTLDQVIVTGERPGDYAPATSTAGTRLDAPPRDVPQALTVFDAGVLRDLAPRVLDEVADYVAGVDREAMQSNPYAISFYFRGFSTAGGATTFNGFRDYGFNTPQSMVNIERIEFLKGPASVLYGGSGALSGLVNVVSKQPQAIAAHRVEATVGSFDHAALSVDSTGPLGGSNRARYRLTAEVDDGGNFVENTEQQSRFVSPSFSFDLGEATRLDVELLAQDIDRPGREAYFIRHPDFFRIPVDVQLGDPESPDGDGGTLTRYSGRVELHHAFANGIRLRQALYASNVRSDDTTIQPQSYNAATGLLNRRVRAVDEYQRERVSQTELSGTSSWFGMEHAWLAGVEIADHTDGYAFVVAPYWPVNIFDPQPGTRLGPLTVPFAPSDSEARTRAVYVQDLVTLGGGFKALVGARFDALESRTGDRGDPSSVVEQTDRAVSPRAGLVWQPDDRQSYYASWSRSFRPNLGVSADGGAFDPQYGTQAEIGAKWTPTDALQVNLSVFEYTRRNVLTADPNDPDLQITVGEQRSRGVELEAIGALHDGWDIVATYGYLDAEITDDNTLPVGSRVTGAPKHSVGLFNKVALAPLGLDRWSATLGVTYADARPSGIPNDPAGPLTADDVELPSYTKVDAGLVYQADRFELRLLGRNLTDERIYDGYISTFQPRAQRSWEVRMAWLF